MALFYFGLNRIVLVRHPTVSRHWKLNRKEKKSEKRKMFFTANHTVSTQRFSLSIRRYKVLVTILISHDLSWLSCGRSGKSSSGRCLAICSSCCDESLVTAAGCESLSGVGPTNFGRISSSLFNFDNLILLLRVCRRVDAVTRVVGANFTLGKTLLLSSLRILWKLRIIFDCLTGLKNKSLKLNYLWNLSLEFTKSSLLIRSRDPKPIRRIFSFSPSIKKVSLNLSKFKMMRSISRLSTLRAATGSVGSRAMSGKPKDPLCAHHKELVPPFSEVCKLKSFELKSDCTTFHIKSEGYDPCKKPSPCPDVKPCPWIISQALAYSDSVESQKLKSVLVTSPLAAERKLCWINPKSLNVKETLLDFICCLASRLGIINFSFVCFPLSQTFGICLLFRSSPSHWRGKHPAKCESWT